MSTSMSTSGLTRLIRLYPSRWISCHVIKYERFDPIKSALYFLQRWNGRESTRNMNFHADFVLVELKIIFSAYRDWIDSPLIIGIVLQQVSCKFHVTSFVCGLHRWNILFLTVGVWFDSVLSINNWANNRCSWWNAIERNAYCRNAVFNVVSEYVFRIVFLLLLISLFRVCCTCCSFPYFYVFCIFWYFMFPYVVFCVFSLILFSFVKKALFSSDIKQMDGFYWTLIFHVPIRQMLTKIKRADS